MVWLCGCGTPPTYLFAHRTEFPVKPGASFECVSAAEKAAKWCAIAPPDRSWAEARLCTAGEFDYDSDCRHPVSAAQRAQKPVRPGS